MRQGLEMVATRCRYSVRELVGTLIALKRPELRATKNPLQRDECFYCSAFVSHLFRQAGIDLAPGLNVKNITPEDVARTLVPHKMYVLERAVAHSSLAAVRDKAKLRVGRARQRVRGDVINLVGKVRSIRRRPAAG